MTERSKRSIAISRDVFQLGRSALSWDGAALTISINETTSPIPSSLRGEVRVEPNFINEKHFRIDSAGRHLWRPVAPSSRIDVSFKDPALNWNGRAYLDSNYGAEPLEKSFSYWDWSRAELSNGETAILYNTDLWNSARRTLALKFSANGKITEFPSPAMTALPPTPVWRVKRRTYAEESAPQVIKTLEDTPFYSRSVIESTICGQKCRSMHESVSGARFRSPIVKAMLPFRMPRL